LSSSARIKGAMNEPGKPALLGEMSSPAGMLHLIAHKVEGTVFVGVRPSPSVADASFAHSAIGLHSGSHQHYVEATAAIENSWVRRAQPPQRARDRSNR
jgi:hypothetical protein